MPDRQHYLIALGSNLGERAATLARAKEVLRAGFGPIVAEADIYETAPVGAADQPFLNSALIAASPFGPEAAMAFLLRTEALLGRVRAGKWENRTLDLDLLLWRDEGGACRAWLSPQLEVPHPRLLERDFALVPAAEIAGAWIHPVTGKSLATEALARFPLGLGSKTFRPKVASVSVQRPPMA